MWMLLAFVLALCSFPLIITGVTSALLITVWGPKQKRLHFADDIFKHIFWVHSMQGIFIQISMRLYMGVALRVI